MPRGSHFAKIAAAAREACKIISKLDVGVPSPWPAADCKTIAAYVLLTRVNPKTDRPEFCVMMRRADAKKFPGARDLPGGKAEAGESLAAAAARECLEETGYAPSAGLEGRMVHSWDPAAGYYSTGGVFVDFVEPDHDCEVAEDKTFEGARFVDVVELVRLAADPAEPFKSDVRRLLLSICQWRL